MAQAVQQDASSTLTTSYLTSQQTPTRIHASGNIQWQVDGSRDAEWQQSPWEGGQALQSWDLSSTYKGILIGMLSAFGTAALVALFVALFYFFRFTSSGRILLDRFSRPGEFDDEQQFLREEEDALAAMDDLQRSEYIRAKAFVQANPPESVHTDISLSQFLAIQEKGVSAWEFEPELEIANCFVEARTEIEFFDSDCSVQSNLPIPKQNEVYYWEAKMYDKPDSTTVSIGLTTKPYPLFRLPGLHRYSLAYLSNGHRRYNQPFNSTNYGPPFLQGDIIGVGYRPRTGAIFFTRNGKKLDEVAHGLKTQNFFPTVGANGPCNVHVNFGQAGFVFLEANVKKWGLAPMTGSLAPPPPYGSEAGTSLLESGREGIREGQGWLPGHARTTSNQARLQTRPTRSPNGPERSPTEISLTQLNLMDYNDVAETERDDNSEDEGREFAFSPPPRLSSYQQRPQVTNPGLPLEPADHPPPEYESPEGSNDGEDSEDEDDSDSTPRASNAHAVEQQRLMRSRGPYDNPPIPSYEAATSRGER